MGRRSDQSLDGWVFEDSLFDDCKIIALNERHGTLGEGVYFRLLCIINHSNGYWAQLDDALITAIFRTCGKGCRGRRHVAEIIDFCAKCGLLDVSLYAQGVITSPGIQRRWLHAKTKARARGLDVTRYWLLTQKPELDSCNNNSDSCSNNPDSCSNNADCCSNNPDYYAQKVSKVNSLPVPTKKENISLIAGAPAREEEEHTGEPQIKIPKLQRDEDYMLVKSFAWQVERHWLEDERIRKYGAELVDVAREYYPECNDYDKRAFIHWETLLEDPAALERAFTGAKYKAGGSRKYLIAALNNNALGL